jgi:hypothetical protein
VEAVTLVEFLTARLDEDEAYADSGYCQCMACMRLRDEAEAKRRIMKWHGGSHECSGPDDIAMWLNDDEDCPTLRALAMPYADHEDYRTEWDPQPNG